MAVKESSTITILKVVAWMAIVLGAFSVLSCVFMLVFWPYLADLVERVRTGNAAYQAHLADTMALSSRMSWLHLPDALAAVAGGIGVLRRRRWGRTILEAAVWLYAVVAATSAAYMAVNFDYSAAFAGGKTPFPAQFQATFTTLARVMGVAMAVVICGIAGVLVWFLRRGETRAWFGPEA